MEAIRGLHTQCDACGRYAVKIIQEVIDDVDEDGDKFERLLEYKLPCSFCANIKRIHERYSSEIMSEVFKSVRISPLIDFDHTNWSAVKPYRGIRFGII